MTMLYTAIIQKRLPSWTNTWKKKKSLNWGASQKRQRLGKILQNYPKYKF
jgi:hypothetical protein